MPTGGTISLTTVFNNIGLSAGNTQSTNQYEFYKGIEWTDLTVTNNQKEFFEKTAEVTRYDWMKQWGSEKLYYENIDDANIHDFKSYYQYAAQYFGGAGPIVSCSGNLLADMSSLALYYKMDSDVTDSSGNGLDGTANAITYVDGKNTNFGSASVFNGTSAYISESSYAVPAGNLSISTWFKLNNWPSVANVNAELFNKYDTGGGSGGIEIKFRTDPGDEEKTIVVTMGDTSGAGISTATLASADGTVNTGTWYHLTATWNGSASRLYIDGSLVATGATAAGNVKDATNDAHWGAWFDKASRFYDGQLDDFQIWNRSLSEAEITTLAAGTCPLVTGDNFLSANLQHYYTFESNSTDSVGGLTGSDTSMTYTAGKYGNAATFNGSTSEITTIGWSAISEGSLSLWFKADTWPGAQDVWLWEAGGAAANYIVYNSSLGLIFKIGGASYVTHGVLSTGTWYHFVLTWDGVNWRHYINGSKTTTAKTETWPTTTDGTFGARYDSARFFDGQIDEFAIWDRKLGDDEVTNLYNSGVGTYYATFSYYREAPAPATGFVEEGLLRYYDSGYGTNTSDSWTDIGLYNVTGQVGASASLSTSGGSSSYLFEGIGGSLDNTIFMAATGSNPITGTQDHTVIAWIYQTGGATNQAISYIGEETVNFHKICMRIVDSTGPKLRLEYKGGGENTTLAVTASQWLQVAYKLNGTQNGDCTSYVNENSFAMSGTDTLDLQNDYLLAGINDPETTQVHPFAGNMAVFMVYNRALSDAEIAQNYQHFKSRFV